MQVAQTAAAQDLTTWLTARIGSLNKQRKYASAPSRKEARNTFVLIEAHLIYYAGQALNKRLFWAPGSSLQPHAELTCCTFPSLCWVIAPMHLLAQLIK